MKISLFQGILIGVFALGAVIGLFVFATYSGGGGRDAVGPVTIWGTLSRDGVESALRLAAQNEDGLKDVKYVEKSSATLAVDLAAAIATGSAPDLVLASQEELRALSRFISPIPSSTLSASTFTSTFIDGARVFSAPSGYWGVPALVDPLVLLYNRSILSSGGIAKPPETWEALTGLVPKVALLTPTRQITRGLIALGTYNNIQNARGILSSLFLQAGVPISGYTSSGVLTADLGIRGGGGTPPGEAVVTFYTQFADTSKVSYTWNASLPNSRQAFQVGDLALYLGYASEARYFREANPNLNFAVAPLPQLGTASVKSAYGRVYALMIPRGAPNGAGAYRVAALLSGGERQALLASSLALAPVNLTILAVPPADPAAAVAYAEALYTRGWLSPAVADVDAVFSGMIGNVITGRLSLEAALATAESALAALLQR